MDTLALAPEAVASPALVIEGTYNFRSTAGYAVTGTAVAAGSVREGSLFRSDALHRLSDAGKQQFAAHGIARVIDLRDDEELRHSPSALAADAVETVHHPVFGGAGLPDTLGTVSIAEVYRYIVEARAERVAGAVRLIADAPAGGVLVHCTAGKDRTGLVVASALAAVGVPREQVVADYAASAENLAGEWAERMLASAAERFGDLDETLRELMTGSPAAAMDQTLDLIDSRYGGVERMLLDNGLDDDALARLRDRLVA